MKKTVVLLGLLLFGLGVFAQKVEKDNLQAMRDLLDESIAYYASDEYRSLSTCYDEFFDKVVVPDPPIGGGEIIDFGDWLNENLALTKFSSAEEGVMLLYKCGLNSEQISQKADEFEGKRNAILKHLTIEEIIELFDEVSVNYIHYEAKQTRQYNDFLKLSAVTANIKPNKP